jgi:hypothetical protein
MSAASFSALRRRIRDWFSRAGGHLKSAAAPQRPKAGLARHCRGVESKMTELFQRQAARCRTVNEFNRLQIALENRITPLEFGKLAQAVEHHDTPSSIRLWIDELGAQLQRSGKPAHEAFRRRRLKPNLYLYSDGVPSPAKTLVIAFSGNARRLMMPTATFLQHLDASALDILFISRHPKSNYRNGICGLATSLEGLIEVLRGLLADVDYKQVMTYGTSSGALPALLTALYLDLPKAIGVGGLSLDHARWRDIQQNTAFRSALKRWNGRPGLTWIYGDQHERDSDAALAVRDALPVSLHAVSGVGEHTALSRYLEAGELRDFLASLFQVNVIE